MRSSELLQRNRVIAANQNERLLGGEIKQALRAPTVQEEVSQALTMTLLSQAIRLIKAEAAQGPDGIHPPKNYEKFTKSCSEVGSRRELIPSNKSDIMSWEGAGTSLESTSNMVGGK